MLPWMIVLAIAAAAVWLLLDRRVVLGTWVLAALILGHGFVHGLYFVPPPSVPAGRAGPAWPFDLERSWLAVLAGARRGRRIAAGFVIAIVATSVLASLATVGIVPAAWWSTLVVFAAGASLALLVLAFDVQLVLGIGIDFALLAVVLAGAWTP
jgi:hypothetical protein